MSELTPLLAGQELGAVRQTLEGDLVLEFAGGRRRERVRLGAGGGRSCLYALQGHPPLADDPGMFAARLADEAVGARLESISKSPEERVVFFRLQRPGARGSLVAELLGRSANLIWIDAQERIVAWARDLQSASRSPRAGERYTPPPADDRPTPWSANPRELETLVRDCIREEGAAARALVRGVRGLGALMSREIEHRVRGGGRPLAEVWSEMLARWRAELWDPRLYTPVEINSLAEDTVLEVSTCLVAPWPLASAAALSCRACATFSEALEIHDRLWERWHRLESARASLAASLGSERRRLERLLEALGADRMRSANAERYRRWGDLLLREKRQVRIEAGEAVVLDTYGSGGEERIPIDPALSVRENAEAMFGRYRKAQRAGPQIERRLREAEGRLGRLSSLEAQAHAVSSVEQARRLAESWSVAPRGGAQARTLRPPEGEPGPEAQAREYRSSEGWVILVGKGAHANQRLTFSVAAPHDFWLHAAETPGAHVLVRNPRRAAQIPVRTLQEAASLAAWFSKSRGAPAVDVHYTQRRYVRRPRGAPAGQVVLKRFRTLRVRPRPPAGD